MYNRLFIYLVAGLLMLAGCAAPQGRTKHRHKAIQHVKQVESSQTWDFLADGFDEDIRAKVYGYVLLPQTLITDARIRTVGEQVAAAMATTLKVRVVRDHEPQGGIVYWPMQGLSPQELEKLKNQTKWQIWVRQYHVERAQLIYTRIQEDSSRPLLVIAAQPLAQVATEFQAQGKQIVVIDLNQVALEKMDGLFQAYAKGISGEKKHSILNQDQARKTFKSYFGTEIESGVYIKKIE